MRERMSEKDVDVCATKKRVCTQELWMLEWVRKEGVCVCERER